LKSGDKARIAVCAILGAAALFGLGFWLAWRVLHRQRNGERGIDDKDKGRLAQHNSTMKADDTSRAYYESDGHPVQELHGQHVPVEAGGRL
jgi:ABC-type nickel/cobalt efflux system permease component RcnA